MNEVVTFFEMQVRMFVIGISLFAIISTILFIKDGIRAKREGTGRKTAITVMFIISMAIIALVVIIALLLFILGMLIVRTM
ncbi:MAG: hypothetical protein K2K17_03160 [Lachnospiraceae bacterium]|nr:hypothetical protein [Lachnospiraceae bacterium]